MEKTPGGWKVLDRKAAVLWREYSFGPAKATTMVFRGAGDGLIVISPGSRIDAAALDELKDFGEVTALVASNGLHWMGQETWHQHFPNARSFAPPSAIARIKKRAPALSEVENLDALAPLLGAHATIQEADGARHNAFANAIAMVETESGNYWYPSDLLANIPKAPPNRIIRMLMSMTDSAPGYKVFRPAIWGGVADRKRLRAWAENEISKATLAAVVPAHGPPVSGADLLERTRSLLALI